MPWAGMILASGSPRRKELLATLGVNFTSRAADIDESVKPGEAPRDYVGRMAREKAEAVAGQWLGKPQPVLGADTTVVVDGEIVGKPVDFADGMAILSRLSGRSHRVITALCLLTPRDIVEELVETQVCFAALDQSTIAAYLATDEPWDKAGAYGIQGLGGALVEEIQGSYSNVVGLPLQSTWKLLRAQGVATALDDG